MSKIFKLNKFFAPGSVVRMILRFPFKTLITYFEIKLPILFGVLRGKTWILNASDLSCWLGLFRSPFQELLKKTLKEGDIFFDCGAHVGYISLLAAKLVGPEGKVFAFEPLSPNLYYLKKHLQLNRINNVSIIEAGVSDTCGNLYIDYPGPHRHVAHLSSDGGQPIETVNIDALIIDGRLPIPNYIKLNIEGSEFLALKGAEKVLRQFHPVIFLSTHGEEIHRQCSDLLINLGYYIELIDEDSNHYSDLYAYQK